MKIEFLDGSVKEYKDGLSALDIAKSISSSLAKKAVYAVVNGKDYDLTRPIEKDASFEIVTKDDVRALECLRHSASHLMASAVKHLYKDAIFGVGPAIEEGFYYDINPGGDIKFDEESLIVIEKEMKRIAAQGIPFERIEVSKKEALDFFKDDRYKQEIISELPEEESITMYKHGEFVDLCRGPHVINTGSLKHVKLLAVSGAYWRGDSKNEQLQRIYGTAFFTKDDLEKHLINLKERAERDHRKLGRELDLFMVSEYGPGLPFWLPNGMALRKTLEDYWYKVHRREGYKFVQTPIILNRELWEVSGHWFNYQENMYSLKVDENEYAIKPMNCPGGMLVYKNSIHSYRDLPLKIGELGLVHRHEASGALSGLFRVRSFTQDDAHVFMTENQIEEEVVKLIKLFDEFYTTFNLTYHLELSTRPDDKFIGTIENWDRSEKALARACEIVGKKYKVNPGDGAFYGPKLDFKLRDSMNRIWQCGTIQLDMNLPERFDLTYVAADGSKKRPVMLHRAIYGSIERMVGILIEHYGGAFPTWMAPIQIKFIPVNVEKHSEYVKKLEKTFIDYDFRFESDYRDEKLGYKIREAQMKKIPYQLIIGDNEVDTNTITFRKHGEKASKTLPIKEFIKLIEEEIRNKGK